MTNKHVTVIDIKATDEELLKAALADNIELSKTARGLIINSLKKRKGVLVNPAVDQASALAIPTSNPKVIPQSVAVSAPQFLPPTLLQSTQSQANPEREAEKELMEAEVQEIREQLQKEQKELIEQKFNEIANQFGSKGHVSAFFSWDFSLSGSNIVLKAPISNKFVFKIFKFKGMSNQLYILILLAYLFFATFIFDLFIFKFKHGSPTYDL